jgi:hypothetical protein
MIGWRWYIGGSALAVALAFAASKAFAMSVPTAALVGVLIGWFVAEAVLWLN